MRIVSISFFALAITACGGGSPNSTGAGETVKATNDIEGAVTVGAVTVGTPNIGRGSATAFEGNLLSIQIPALSAGGLTNITASVVDITKTNALISSQSYAVIFSSNCEGKTPSKASFTPKTVITTTGEVSSSYKALGCAGDDAITATLYTVSGTPASADTSTALALATGALTVENAEVGSVGFVSNEVDSLGFAGIGNGALQATSIVTFNVKDNFGNPLESKEVTFALSSSAAGASLSSVSGVTDAEGVVTTTVNAGTTHGLLSVEASTTTNTGILLRTSSTPISVSTGIAEQSNFEISTSSFNPAAYDISGAEVNITVRASDHFHNPIPEGTIIHFTAESGSIPATCITAAAGGCTVTWTSTATRPGNYDPNLGSTKNDEYLPDLGVVTTSSLQATRGITTITAYTLGEGGFTDKNSNGVFDIGESFLTHPEVFRDDNGNGVLDDGAKYEEFFELDPDGSYTGALTKYQGVLCSEAAKADGHCENLMYVNDSLRLTQSQANSAYFDRYFTRVGNVYTEVTSFTAGSGVLYVVITDENGNTPPELTKVGFSIGASYSFIGGGEVPNSSNGIFSESIQHPMNRGAVFPVSITKAGTPDPTTFTPSIELEATKNLRVGVGITIN
jgi:hypothetical protein